MQHILKLASLSRQVEVEVFDHTLKLQQAPDSHDLGQTGELLMVVSWYSSLSSHVGCFFLTRLRPSVWSSNLVANSDPTTLQYGTLP